MVDVGHPAQLVLQRGGAGEARARALVPPSSLKSPALSPSSPLPQSSVERERDVIMREMQEVESQIEEVVFDRLHEVAVGMPLARTILGPEENIRSISVDDIQWYVKTHYTAPRMVVAAAGAIDHGELVNAVGEPLAACRRARLGLRV